MSTLWNNKQELLELNRNSEGICPYFTFLLIPNTIPVRISSIGLFLVNKEKILFNAVLHSHKMLIVVRGKKILHRLAW